MLVLNLDLMKSYFLHFYFSQSDDATVYRYIGTFNYERTTNDHSLFELSANYRRCRYCHNDRIIIWYDWTDKCSDRYDGFFTAKYIFEEGVKRHRHSPFTIAACTRTISFIHVFARMDLFRCIECNQTSNHRKLPFIFISMCLCMIR